MNSEITLSTLANIALIFGWFWLMIYTILRSNYFKKRYLLVLIFIYFVQGTTRISGLILADLKGCDELPTTLISDFLSILGFSFIILTYANFKSQLSNE